MQRTRPYKATPFKAPARTPRPSLARARSIPSNRTIIARRTGELKYFDTTNSFAFDSTGEVPATGQLNIIPQGVNEQERIGRKIHVKSIHCHFQIAPNVATWNGSASGTFIRLMLVQDKQANGAAATYSGVGGVLQSDTVGSFRNLTNSNRFVVLKDWYFALNATAGVTSSFNSTSKVLEFNSKCDIPIEYDNVATTGALTTIRSNNLFLLARSTEDDIISCSGVTRIRFMDG